MKCKHSKCSNEVPKGRYKYCSNECMYNHQKQYLRDNYQPKVNLNYCIHCSKKLTGSKKYYCSHQCQMCIRDRPSSCSR